MAKRFQTKDLMITLADAEEEQRALDEAQICRVGGTVCRLGGSVCDPTFHCPGNTIWGCGEHTFCVRGTNCFRGTGCFPATGGCGVNFSMCQWSGIFEGTPQITPRIQRGQPARRIQNLEDVQAMRKELEATLKELDEVEAQLSGPASVEEAEELESKLEDALKELKARKKKLEKSG